MSLTFIGTSRAEASADGADGAPPGDEEAERHVTESADRGSGHVR
jgi:hypothetical protein